MSSSNSLVVKLVKWLNKGWGGGGRLIINVPIVAEEGSVYQIMLGISYECIVLTDIVEAHPYTFVWVMTTQQ